MIGIPEKPNLLFIFSDRQRYDTISCYFNHWIKTPKLNEFTNKSFIFEHAYVTQPVCAPARSSILTGLYPHATGVLRNKLLMRREVKTIAELVSPEYIRAYFGKWHLGDEIIAQHGFHHWASTMDIRSEELYTNSKYLQRFSDYHTYLSDKGFKPDMIVPGGEIFSHLFRAQLPAEHQMACFLADRAIDFIESHREKPFILYVSFFEPHPPWTGPYDDLYDPNTIPIEPSFLKKPQGGSLFNRMRADFFMQCKTDGHDLSTEAGWKQLRASYFGRITLVDNAFGKIINALEEADLTENTIVVFTSEHGEMLGAHAMLELRTFYEEVSRAPLIIRIPWLIDGSCTIPGNFSQVDLTQTLMDLMGENVPQGMQGLSRAGVLRGDATLKDNDVFIQHNGIGDRDLCEEVEHDALPELVRNINLMNTLPARSVVTSDRWKLNLCVGDQCELFDLKEDPYEEHNLFDHPTHRNRVRTMAARLRVWQHQTGDTAPLPSV